MANPKDVIEDLTEKLKQNSSVVAFTLVGSQARKDVYKATEHSDMEAYIVVKDEATEEVEQQLPHLVSQLGNVLFSFKHQVGFVAVFDDLFRLELPVIKLSDIESLFSRPKAQVVDVLIDNTNGQLEKVLNARPEAIDYAKLFEDKVTNFWYWQILAVQYYKKGEYYNSRAVVGINTSALIKLFELLNDPTILLLETNKRIEQFLTEEQLELLKEISPVYNNQEIKQSIIKSMEIFSETTKAVKDKYSYSYDESLEGKIKPKLLELLSE